MAQQWASHRVRSKGVKLAGGCDSRGGLFFRLLPCASHSGRQRAEAYPVSLWAWSISWRTWKRHEILKAVCVNKVLLEHSHSPACVLSVAVLCYNRHTPKAGAICCLALYRKRWPAPSPFGSTRIYLLDRCWLTPVESKYVLRFGPVLKGRRKSHSSYPPGSGTVPGDPDLDTVRLQQHAAPVSAVSRSNVLGFLGETSLTLTHAMSTGLHGWYEDGHVVYLEHEPQQGPSVGRKGPSLLWLETDFVGFGLRPPEAPCCPGHPWRRAWRTSLVVQWSRIRLPMPGTVWSLVQEDSTWHGATKPMHHNFWARDNIGLCNKRSHSYEKLVRHNWRADLCSNKDPAQSKTDV